MISTTMLSTKLSPTTPLPIGEISFLYNIIIQMTIVDDNQNLPDTGFIWDHINKVIDVNLDLKLLFCSSSEITFRISSRIKPVSIGTLLSISYIFMISRSDNTGKV